MTDEPTGAIKVSGSATVDEEFYTLQVDWDDVLQYWLDEAMTSGVMEGRCEADLLTYLKEHDGKATYADAKAFSRQQQGIGTSPGAPDEEAWSVGFHAAWTAVKRDEA